MYTIESEIVGGPVAGVTQLIRRAEPLYAFDSDSISHCFPRYRRVMSPTGHVRIDERIIAPVPDKSEGLKEAFMRESYAKAHAMVRQAGSLIAIGYSFNPYDRVPYGPVLRALGQSDDRSLIIISPHARELARRISVEYPELKVQPVEKAFGRWAADHFEV